MFSFRTDVYSIGSSVCGAVEEWRTNGPGKGDEEEEDMADEEATAAAGVLVVVVAAAAALCTALVTRRENIEDIIILFTSVSGMEDASKEDVSSEENDFPGR